MNVPSWLPEDDGAHDRTLEHNWLFRLRRERFKSRATGKSHDYFVLRLADAVHVVAVTPDDQVVLVRQFRAGSGRDSLEPPGGLLDAGEDPCVAGTRELREETGYEGDPAFLLGDVWANASILGSRIATVVITNARRVAEPKLDPNEEVVVELLPATALTRAILEGRIDHGLAVLSLFWWLGTRPGGLALEPPDPGSRRRTS